MVQAKTIRLMNELVAIHGKSLASYLTYASPAWHRGDEEARVVLNNIAEQHRETVDRLGEWIVEHNGVVNHGAYPMTYTAYHDLSFDFLLTRLIELQGKDVAYIEASVGQLFEPEPQEMAQEILGEAKAHLDSLVELQK